MNRDLTSQNLIGSIKILLIIMASLMLLLTLIGVIFACQGLFEPIAMVLYFVLVNLFLIIIYLPNIIYCAVKYKRFKKLLKTSDIFYGNLDEVQTTFLIWRPFLVGCRAIVNGHDTLCIYSYNSVKRMVNKKVAYIFDGDVAYLLREQH